MLVGDQAGDSTLVQQFLLLASGIDSCFRFPLKCHTKILKWSLQIASVTVRFSQIPAGISWLLAELRCCATEHVTSCTVVSHTATYILELLGRRIGKRHREHDTGFWQAYGEDWRKVVVHCAAVTNLYAVLPDFTVKATRPVFATVTDELSRKSTRS